MCTGIKRRKVETGPRERFFLYRRYCRQACSLPQYTILSTGSYCGSLMSGQTWFRLLVSFELIYHPWIFQGTGPWPNIGVISTNTLGRGTLSLVRTWVRRCVLQTRIILATRYFYCGRYVVASKVEPAATRASVLDVQTSFRSSPITSSLRLAYYVLQSTTTLGHPSNSVGANTSHQLLVLRWAGGRTSLIS